ncbi:MAG: AraC family transcriptional regulator [Oscillospiraceae bacterium]
MLHNISVHRIVKDIKKTGQYIETHKHEYYHFIYGICGNACVTVDKTDYLLEKGTLVMVPPGTDHAVYSLDTSCSLSIKFTCDRNIKNKIQGLPICLKHLDEYQDEMLKSLFEEAVNQQACYGEMIDLRFNELLILLERRFKAEADSKRTIYPLPTSTRKKRLQKGIEFIQNNLEKPITVAQVAEVCGYHKNYLTEVFRGETGFTPNEYICQGKMAMARDLMLYSDLNITQVSEKLGFESIHYFSRVFKKTMGIPPSEYIFRTRSDKGINIIHNRYTPPGEFEIPLKDSADLKAPETAIIDNTSL